MHYVNKNNNGSSFEFYDKQLVNEQLTAQLGRVASTNKREALVPVRRHALLSLTAMNQETSRQTLTSVSSTASTVDRVRVRRANDTPVKQKSDISERAIPTPNSARHHKPWRGVTPHHNSKPDFTLVSRYCLC